MKSKEKKSKVKQKKHFFLFLTCTLIYSALCTSCMDSDVQEINTGNEISISEKVTDDGSRLKFESSNEFQTVFNDYVKNGGKESELYQSKISKFKNFLSLSSFNEDPEKVKNNTHFRVMEEDEVDSLNELAMELIPDIDFRQFWNKDLEITVNDTIYKLIPQGLLFYQGRQL